MAESEEEADEYIDLRSEVTRLIRTDRCKGSCLQGRASSLELFLKNRIKLTPAQKRVCMTTALSTLFKADTAQPSRSRSSGVRHRFSHYVSYFGKVCKASFSNCFGVSSSIVARYKAMIRNGDFVYGLEA